MFSPRTQTLRRSNAVKDFKKLSKDSDKDITVKDILEVLEKEDKVKENYKIISKFVNFINKSEEEANNVNSVIKIN